MLRCAMSGATRGYLLSLCDIERRLLIAGLCCSERRAVGDTLQGKGQVTLFPGTTIRLGEPAPSRLRTCPPPSVAVALGMCEPAAH